MSLSPAPVAYYPLGDQDAFNGADYLVPNSSLKDFVFDFNRNQYVFVNNLTDFFNPTRFPDGFTISFWVKNWMTTVVSNKSQQLVSQTVVVDLFSRWNNTSEFRFWLNTGSASSYQFANNNIHWSDNTQWVNLVTVWDRAAGTLVLYSNKQAGTINNTAPTSWGTPSTGIATSFGGTSNWNGTDIKMSNVQIWSTPLTSSEVETVYNNGSPIQNLSDIPQNSDLELWYKLDASATYDSSTTTWTVPDDSTNSNDGTSSGMTQANLVQSDLSFTSGYSPYALAFDGTDDYISITNVDLGITSTLSMWANLTGTINYTLLGSNYTYKYTVFVTATDIYFRVSGAYMVIDVTNYLTTDNWHNIVITRDNLSVKCYFNNVLIHNSSTWTYGNPGTSGTQVNTIGAEPDNTKHTNGKLSNFSFWNAALSSTQVTEIYSEGVPQNLNNHSAYSNLVSWWQLGSNSSFSTNWTVLDEKGSNNGTSSNMTEDDIVDGVGSYANGLSSGMGGDEVTGDAPYSSSNSLSVNMDVLDRTDDTPS